MASLAYGRRRLWSVSERHVSDGLEKSVASRVFLENQRCGTILCEGLLSQVTEVYEEYQFRTILPGIENAVNQCRLNDEAEPVGFDSLLQVPRPGSSFVGYSAAWVSPEKDLLTVMLLPDGKFNS
jgi:hypothetical protein